MFRPFFALGLVALTALTVHAAEPAVAADLVVVNAKIWTVNAKMPEAEALAVVRDRIAAVGKDADIRAMIGPKTRVLDLKGQRVVPGFYDSHVHMLGSGMRLAEVPTTWRDRTAGESRFRLWKWLPRYLHWYWRGIGGRFRRRGQNNR